MLKSEVEFFISRFFLGMGQYYLHGRPSIHPWRQLARSAAFDSLAE